MGSRPELALAEMAMEMDIVDPELIERYLEAIPEAERSPESLLAYCAASGKVPGEKLTILRTCWNTAKKLQSKSNSGEVAAPTPPPASPPEPEEEPEVVEPDPEPESDWVAAFEQGAEDETVEVVAEPEAQSEPEVLAAPPGPDPEALRPTPSTPIPAVSQEAPPAVAPALPEKFTVICPACKKGFFAPGVMAGKPGKCGFCKHVFLIPTPPPTPAPEPEPQPRAITRRTSKGSEALASKSGPGRVAQRRQRRKSSPMPLVLVGAGILILGAVIVVVRGDPNSAALAQANNLLDLRKVKKASAILQRLERGGPLSEEGLELKGRMEALSRSRREVCAKRVEDRLARGQGPQARRVLDEVKDDVVATDLAILEESYRKKIDAALACARALRLGKEGKVDEALELVEKLPEELIPERYATLVMDLKVRLLEDAGRLAREAAALAWGGDLDAAYASFDKVSGAIGNVTRRGAKRAELAKIAEQGEIGRKARALLEEGQAGAAFALLAVNLREARAVPEALALAKMAEERFESALKLDIAEGRLDQAWKQVAAAGVPLVRKVQRLDDLRGRLRVELQKRERERFNDHLAAGRLDLAAGVLEGWRKSPWGPGAAELGRLERSVGEARGDAVAEKSRRRFAKIRPRLKKAYEDNDLIAVEGMLTTGGWYGGAVKARIATEKQVLEHVRSLCSAALSALAKRRGQEVILNMRRGGKVSCEVHLIDAPRRELTVKVGGGLAVYKLSSLAWDDIPRFARQAGSRKEQAFRTAVLEYALGRFAVAKASLENERDRPLTGALLAIIERGGDLAATGSAKPKPEPRSPGPKPAPKPVAPKPSGPINPGGGQPEGPEPPGKGRPAGLGDLAQGGPQLAEALSFYKRKLLAKAREKLDAVLASSPNNADALALRGTIAFDHGRFKESLADLEKAVSLDEAWSDEVSRVKALVAFLYGKDEEAARHLAAIEVPGPVVEYLSRLLKVTDLTKVKSKKGRYLVYSDEAMVKSGGQAYAARVLDLIYAAYSKVFPFEKDEKIISRCFIFSRTSAFLSFSARIGHDGTGAAGYFAPLTRILVINADPQGAPVNKQGFTVDAVDTMFHEGFHQFLHFYVPHVPIWFNEGLAEYFGPSILVAKGKLKVGHFVRFSPSKTGASRLELIKGVVREEYGVSALPLRAFIDQTQRQYMMGGSRTSVNYAQGWSFVHFLLHSDVLKDKGRKLIKKYFKIIREGHGVEAAYQGTFAGTDMGALEQAWKEYVRKL